MGAEPEPENKQAVAACKPPTSANANNANANLKLISPLLGQALDRWGARVCLRDAGAPGSMPVSQDRFITSVMILYDSV